MGDKKRNISNMLCLDIYFSSLDKKEQAKLSRKLKGTDQNIHSLLSGDIYVNYRHQLALEEKRKNDLEILLQFHRKANWITNIEEILQQEYHTLVLTDSNQIIQWANKSFSAMTGYPVNYAVGRSPRFLQGENTSEETRKKIRQQLVLKKPFTETVINYRKNKEEYPCRVSIYPMVNAQQEIMHFLALECEEIN